MPTLGIDRSHHNAEPNFAVMKKNGFGFVLCKCTEGVGFLDNTFDECRAGTETAGMVFGSYHFARWGDVNAEAAYYLRHATPRPGELVCLDAEAAVPPGVDVVAWSMAFSRIVHSATGAWPLIYMNSSWLGGHNWAPLVALGDGLFLAKYDGSSTGGPLGPWPVLAMKQFTDRGTVPGQPGPIDEDAFQGDLAALLRYAVPAHQGDDMPAYSQWSQADKDALRLDVAYTVWSTPNPQPAWGPGDTVWPLDRLRGIDSKTGQTPPLVLGADQLAALRDAVVQVLGDVIVQRVIDAMDTDLASRFGPKGS